MGTAIINRRTHKGHYKNYKGETEDKRCGGGEQENGG